MSDELNISIRPLEPKEKLALELVQLMKLEEFLTASVRPQLDWPQMLEGPPPSDKQKDLVLKRVVEAFMAERPQLVRIIEEVFTEEELRFQVELYKNPLYLNMMSKVGRMNELLTEAIARMQERLSR